MKMVQNMKSAQLGYQVVLRMLPAKGNGAEHERPVQDI